MGIVVEKGVITAPGSTGNQTYNLGSAFNGILPKALILWATYETADGDTDGDGIFSLGVGTYRGDVVQQAFVAQFSDDAGTSASCDISIDTDAILEGMTVEGTEGTSRDYSVDLVSLNAGTPSNFVLNWTDVPASAILIHYWIIGGSDVEDAVVGSFTLTTAVASQDVSLPSGFGTPDSGDLILLLSGGSTAAYARSNATCIIGACKGDGSSDRVTAYGDADNAPNMIVGSWQGEAALVNFVAGVTAMDAVATVSTGPTDSFTINYSDQAALATLFKYLIIRLGAGATLDIGSATAPTSGAPFLQELTTSGTPKGALVWGNNLPTTAGFTGSDADLGCFMVGGTDGTNEGMCGRSQDDANANAVTGRFFKSNKTIAFYVPGAAPSLQSEADGAFVGSDFELTWNDVDSVAREFNYLVVGEVAAIAGPAYPRPNKSNLARARRRM